MVQFRQQMHRPAQTVWSAPLLGPVLVEPVPETSYDGMTRSALTGRSGQSRCRARDNVFYKPDNSIS
jgi:hypothetical protein